MRLCYDISKYWDMKKSYKIILAITVSLCFIALLILVSRNAHFAVLDPKGVIATQQRDLMKKVLLLMFIVTIPVFALTAFIVWRYREGKDAAYKPDWDHNRLAETIWWGIPLVIILLISGLTWTSSHKLDPFRKIEASNSEPIKIQVVALDWKWLFIYPKYNIATVNMAQIPEDTPIDFEVTADAPMNSFWIPQLGGQIYAMSGMATHLNLMADQPGEYRGSSANLSGEGFAEFYCEGRLPRGFQVMGVGN